LIRNESYGADQKLKREFEADIVDGVATETRFSHIAVRQVYLPVYSWTCDYEGSHYRFVVNGQSGASHGDRPWAYGVGKVADAAVRAVAGGGVVGCMVLPGKELCELDKVDIYSSSLHYFTWPASDQFLVWVAVGWITLKNSSSEPLVLQAQKRFVSDESEKPTEYTLQGKKQVHVAYRGYWCITVVSGDYKELSIVKVSTTAGQDKEDLLGMLQ